MKLKFSRKREDGKLELVREQKEVMTREQALQRIAILELKISDLRAVIAEYDVA